MPPIPGEAINRVPMTGAAHVPTDNAVFNAAAESTS